MARILALLQLWCRPEAVARIRPLAWKPPYAFGEALEKTKKTKKTTKKTISRDTILLKYRFNIANMMMGEFDVLYLNG